MADGPEAVEVSFPPAEAPDQALEWTGHAPWPRVAACVVACALFGAVDGIHVLAILVGYGVWRESMLVEQLVPGFGLRALPVPTHCLPVQRWLETTGQLGSQLWVLAVTVGSGLIAGVLVIGIIHPHLDRALRKRTFGAFKLALAGLLSLVALVLAFWPLDPEVMGTHFPYTRAALAGGLLLLLWHRRGWLHADDDWPSYLTLGTRFVTGAGLGVLSATLLGHRPHGADRALVEGWFNAGLYSSEMWRAIGGYVIVERAWYGLIIGSLAVTLAPNGLPLVQRLRTALCALAVCGAVWGLFPLWRDLWTRQHQVGLSLPTVIQAELGDLPARFQRVILLGPAGRPLRAFAAPANSISDLPFDPAVTTEVRRYLRDRPPVSSLARQAAIHLHDEASYHWSQQRMLLLQLEQLRSPSATPGFAAVLVETVSLTSATPEATAALDALLDPEQFVWPTGEAAEVLAELAWRWGRLDEVRDRVRARRPDLLERFDQVPSPTCDTRLTGRLMLNGRPLAGARVGILAPLDTIALQAAIVMPWPQRRIVRSAVTAADGSFALDGAVEGLYRLVVAIDGEADPVGDQDVISLDRIGLIALTRETPARDVGVIRLETRPPQPAIRRPPAPPGDLPLPSLEPLSSRATR